MRGGQGYPLCSFTPSVLATACIRCSLLLHSKIASIHADFGHLGDFHLAHYNNFLSAPKANLYLNPSARSRYMQPILRRQSSETSVLSHSLATLQQNRKLERLNGGSLRQGAVCNSSQRPLPDDLTLTKLDKMEDDSDGATFTVEDAIEGLGFGSYQGWLLAYAGMSWTAEAMEMMLLSFVGPAVQIDWNLSSRQESAIASVVFAGMMIGAYSWGVLSDLKGRRFGFFATAVLTFVAGLLSAVSPNYMTLLLLRGLVGIGLGGGPVVSAWFMEFIPSTNRGLWMVIMTLFWTLGSVAEASLAWAVMPNLGWRWLLGLSSFPLAILLLFYPIVPESPRYLAAKGETLRANAILQKMASMNGRLLPAGRLVGSKDATRGMEVEQTLASVNGQVVKDLPSTDIEEMNLLQEHGEEGLPGQGKGKFIVADVFSMFSTLLSPPLISSTILLWSVFFANAFTYYGLVLLTSELSGGRVCGVDMAAPTAIDSSGSNLYRDIFLTSIAEFPGLAVAAAIVDRLGRKRSMAALFALCGLFLLPLVQVQNEYLTTFLLFGARACIMGAFTVLYIYAPEVYPTNSRSTGLGIANTFARVGGLVCPLVAVELVGSCQQGLAVSLFSAVPLLASVAVLFFPIETNGRPLSDTVEGSTGLRRTDK